MNNAFNLQNILILDWYYDSLFFLSCYYIKDTFKKHKVKLFVFKFN